MTNGWKIFAIILLILLILETGTFFWLLNEGLNIVNKENKCAINVCGDEKYGSYYFDAVEDICYCYIDGIEGYVHREVVE